MLGTKFVRQNLKAVEQALSARGEKADLELFVSCDAKRREVLLEIEELRHRRNVVSDKIAELKKRGEDAEDLGHGRGWPLDRRR